MRANVPYGVCESVTCVPRRLLRRGPTRVCFLGGAPDAWTWAVICRSSHVIFEARPALHVALSRVLVLVLGRARDGESREALSLCLLPAGTRFL